MRADITISGVAIAPSWETTETLIRESLSLNDGRLTRIARPDGSCDYRKLGRYELTYTPVIGDNVYVNLNITR